jgi:hypothetical protein
MSTHTPWGDLSPQIKAPFLERAKAAVAGLIVAEKPMKHWSTGFEMGIQANWAENSQDVVEAIAEDFYNTAVAFCEDGKKPF